MADAQNYVTLSGRNQLLPERCLLRTITKFRRLRNSVSYEITRSITAFTTVCPEFETRPGFQLPLLRFFVVSLSPPRKFWDSALN